MITVASDSSFECKSNVFPGGWRSPSFYVHIWRQMGLRGRGWTGTVNSRVRLHKEPGMLPVRVAWSAADKRGLHSAGLQPNWDKQAHHSAARLSLLPHPHPHAARQQTGCPSINGKTHHLFPPHCCFHQTWIPMCLPWCSAGQEPQHTALQNPQCNSGHTGLFKAVLTLERWNLWMIRPLKSRGCHFYLKMYVWGENMNIFVL